MRKAICIIGSAIVVITILHDRRPKPELFQGQMKAFRDMAAIRSLEGLAGNWRFLLSELDGHKSIDQP